MTTNKILKTVLSAAIISTLTACGGGGGNESSGGVGIILPPVDTITAIHKIDLNDVQGIFMTGSESALTAKVIQAKTKTTRMGFSSQAKTAKSVAILENDTAYKILKDGTIEELTIQASDGSDADRGTVNIIYIDEVSKNYKVIYLYNEVNNAPSPYLLHNLSGRLYSLGEAIKTLNVNKVWTEDNFTWEAIAIDAVETKEGNLFIRDADNVVIISKPLETDTEILAKQIVDITGDWTITQDSQYILFSAGNDNGTSSDDVFAINVDSQARYNMNALIAKELNTGLILLDGNIVHSFDGKTYLYDSTNAGECTAYEIISGDDGLPSVKAKVEFSNTVNGYSQDPNDYVQGPTDHGGTNCINQSTLKQVSINGDTYYQDAEFNLLSIDWNNKTFSNITKHIAKNHVATGGNYNIAVNLVNQRNLKMDLPKSLSVGGDYVYRTGVFSESSNSYLINPDGTASMDYFVSSDVAYERINVKTGESVVLFSKDSDFVLSHINVVADGTLYVQGQQLSSGAAFLGTLDLDGNVAITSSSGTYDMPKIITMMMISTTDMVGIDGNPNDWAIDYRTLTDATNDQTSGDIDLTYYSEDSGNGYYFGLIEHTSSLTKDTAVEMVLSNGDKLVVEKDVFTHFNSEMVKVISSDVTFAQGAAFEFKLNLKSIGENTSMKSITVNNNGALIDTME